MSLREERCKKVCRILDNVLANRPTERDSLILAVRKAFAEPQERKGKWIFNQYDANPRIGNWHCSECGQITIMPHDVCNYCPNCGCKMEVG